MLLTIYSLHYDIVFDSLLSIIYDSRNTSHVLLELPVIKFNKFRISLVNLTV